MKSTYEFGEKVLSEEYDSEISKFILRDIYFFETRDTIKESIIFIESVNIDDI